MKKRMNAKVFCRNNEYGKMDFYLEMDREFFLPLYDKLLRQEYL